MHLPPQRPRMAAKPRIDASSQSHARPPAPRTGRQPHRRRRGGRTSCERGQGTGRKRHRRRRQPDRHLHRWRRPAADRHHRRRQRHDRMAIWRWRSIATPPPSSTTRICCASARSGSAARRCPRSARWRSSASPRATPASRMPGRCRSKAARNPQIMPAALGAGHPRRGQRSLLCDAGAAEIPQDRPHRGRSDPRGGAAAGDGAARHRLHARRRRARAGDLGRGAARRRRPADAARRYPGRGFPLQRHRGARRARRRRGRRLCRRAVADPRQRARAISVRQRPPGARQADPRRGARGLFRLSAARPPSGGGAVRDAAIRRRSMPMCIRPRPRCGSATPAWSAR